MDHGTTEYDPESGVKKMGAAILAIQLFLQFATVLPGLITAIESAFGGKSNGNGPAKKEAVMLTVKTGIDLANKIAGKPVLDASKKQTIVDAAGALTDGVVGVLNAAGVLKPAEAPQA